jgi:hypothetical protein
MGFRFNGCGALARALPTKSAASVLTRLAVEERRGDMAGR